ncbi:hypothetical protein [Limnohabitans sp. Bal53]|jgi:hypothetical protein|uniref:hypothetical protein n=1 Tax=Limnohabitans sp. Bal53 TaxID=1977910 RepID=UPI000D3554F9|nr:hypothetical protein [Limnohabitans sp. Bal53]PUE43063.1 hypothetical protein B9Z50_04570 [Limnohabitans sp. Bal53]
MSIGRSTRDTETDPFYDMLFNMLIAFVFCFVIALLAFNPLAKKAGDVPAKAEFMITVSWPDENPNDLDTWVMEPGGKVLWFRQRDVGMLHLDRDDRGDKNNSVVVNGKTITSAARQEIVTLRGLVAGEYVVNAHYYESRNQLPVDATVTVVKINPQAQIVFTGTQQIGAKGEERTLVRFSIDDSGQVLDVNTQPKPIVLRSGI